LAVLRRQRTVRLRVTPFVKKAIEMSRELFEISLIACAGGNRPSFARPQHVDYRRFRLSLRHGNTSNCDAFAKFHLLFVERVHLIRHVEASQQFDIALESRHARQLVAAGSLPPARMARPHVRTLT